MFSGVTCNPQQGKFFLTSSNILSKVSTFESVSKMCHPCNGKRRNEEITYVSFPMAAIQNIGTGCGYLTFPVGESSINIS